MAKLSGFLKNNTVLLIAALAAIVSSFFYLPSIDLFIRYIDIKTIVCLFCIIGILEGCKNIRLFRIIAAYLLKKFSSSRKMVFALVFITFFFSMFIANDMALLTFLPFTYMVLEKTKNVKLIGFTIIMQNIAANLGGMLTPFGNPQNLYLYSYYNIPTTDFLSAMLLPFLISVVLLVACCMFVKDTQLNYSIENYNGTSLKKAVLYGILFFLSILAVFRVVDYIIILIIVFIALVISDRRALLTVDYPLLLTFIFFFIFTGNISNIPEVSAFLDRIILQSPFFSALLSCQLISNVPTAVLFSKFVPYGNYKHLLWAVNIGGMGTLIASLASLISYKSFAKNYKTGKVKYLAGYTLINFSFIAVFVLMYLLVFHIN